tara:strand:+ start:504 stop:773 length:270 start_codon:yes stop_codon:yes gene_type:complete
LFSQDELGEVFAHAQARDYLGLDSAEDYFASRGNYSASMSRELKPHEVLPYEVTRLAQSYMHPHPQRFYQKHATLEERPSQIQLAGLLG